MKRALFAVSALLCLATLAVGDVYLHNPRGSNNRQNEDKRERTNPNRLFNSQNNNRGGVNAGVQSMRFYGGSKLRIEWANQHSCGDENNNCEIVLQYMCGDNVRDGTTTSTVPLNQAACKNRDCDTDERFGLHESFQYYQKCAMRERNHGLFIAEQAVRESARSTRQNAAGTRYGYECQEERDYYPYWGPTPWKDIAIFTNNPERCDYYQRESQNVKSKFECIMDDELLERGTNKISLFLQKRDCLYSTEKVGAKPYNGQWVERPAHGIPAPECLKSPWSRDNHQGNTLGGEFMSYDWTLPDLEEENCVLRIRYNISTNDYDSWNVDACEPGPREIWEKFGLTQREAKRREYDFKSPDRKLDVLGVTRKGGRRVQLQIPIDTAQFGRTFQDRSHTFKIVRKPKDYGDAVIHNVNVRGKRGNIVQVYPSVEYDFVPNTLLASVGDLVHYQWTGSDNNPANNAGQGKAKTDRSNVVQLASRTFPEGMYPLEERNISWATNYPIPPSTLLSNEEVNKRWNFLGLGWQATEDLAHLERCAGEDPLLDEKSAYYDLGPQKLTTTGTYYYMSTRNNAFSNRDQKASVKVAEEEYTPGDKGASYRGFVSVTVNGHTCQRWDSQTPHNHTFDPRDRPEHGLEANFCRNPNDRKKPWCFTTDPNVKWEYCHVPEKAAVRTRRAIERDDAVFPQTDEDTILPEIEIFE